MRRTLTRILLAASPFLAVLAWGLVDLGLELAGRETMSGAMRAVAPTSYCIPLFAVAFWGYVGGALTIHWFFYRN